MVKTNNSYVLFYDWYIIKIKLLPCQQMIIREVMKLVCLWSSGAVLASDTRRARAGG